MKKFLLLAVVMFANLTASAQQDVGTWSVIPKLGFNLANLAGDVSNNSIKFGLVVGGDVMYQVSPLVGVSAGAFYSVQGCEGTGDSSFSLGEIKTDAIRTGVKFATSTSKVYRVYNVGGKLLGTVDMTGKKASAALSDAGFTKGVYMLKSVDGRKSFMTSVAR